MERRRHIRGIEVREQLRDGFAILADAGLSRRLLEGQSMMGRLVPDHRGPEQPIVRVRPAEIVERAHVQQHAPARPRKRALAVQLGERQTVHRRGPGRPDERVRRVEQQAGKLPASYTGLGGSDEDPYHRRLVLRQQLAV